MSFRTTLRTLMENAAAAIFILVFATSVSVAESNQQGDAGGSERGDYDRLNLQPDCIFGDANGDGGFDWADGIAIYEFLCMGAVVTFSDCADADGDCDIDAFDVAYILAFFFMGGDAPVAPGCTDPPVEYDPVGPDTVRIAPDGISVNVGQAFSVPIHLTNDETASSLDFNQIFFDYTSGSGILRCDSVTYWGTRLESSPPLPDRTFMETDFETPDGGYVLLTMYAVADPDTLLAGAGDIANLWFTAVAEGEADISLTHEDSLITMPFPANGMLEYYFCFSPILEFGTITIGESGGGVDCVLSSTDPAFVATPAGSHPFVVTLRDANGDPIEGSSDVSVEIVNVAGLEICSTQTAFPVLTPVAPSDADGKVRFYLAAGNCVPSCMAVVSSSCGEIATVPVRCVDSDGDLYVDPSVDFTTDPNCSDFNNDGVVGADDQNIFNLYTWQLCGDPCSAYRMSISFSPEDDLTVGTLIDIQMTFENTTADACSLLSVVFYSSCFGGGEPDQEIGSYDLNRRVEPGMSYSKGIVEYPIPSCGLGCLTVVVNVADCPEPLSVKTCPQVYFECTPQAGTCYEFKTWLSSAKYVFVEPPTTLPPGFILVQEPVEGWYQFNDTVKVEICHTDVAVIQDSVIYRFYLSDDDQRSEDDDPYMNKVIVRANTGDCTADCFVDIDDVVFLIAFIFSGGPEPSPLQIGNVDCSDPLPVDIDDPVYLINYIFSGGDAPLFCPELW